MNAIKYGTTFSVGTVQEALEASNLDFTVEKEHRYIPGPEGTFIIDEGRYRTFRTDTGETLGDVKGKYTVLQPIQCFDWVDNLVEESKGSASLVNAGTVGGTSPFIWLTVDLGSGDVTPGDRINKLLLITTAFDGTKPLQVQFITNRFFCTNQMSSDSGIRIKHYPSAEGKLKLAKEALHKSAFSFEATFDMFQKMSKVLVTNDDEAIRILLDIMNVDPENQIRYLNDDFSGLIKQPTFKNELDRIFHRWRLNTDKVENPNTLYGLHNAVTGYYEHEKTTRNFNEFSGAQSYFFGTLAKAKQRSFDVCKSLALVA